MDPGQHDLLAAALQRGADIRQDMLHRTAAPGAAGEGGDTKCTAIITAILYFDESPGAQARPGNRLPGDWLQVEGILRKLEEVGYQVILLTVRHQARNRRKLPSRNRIQRRPAAGDDDLPRTERGLPGGSYPASLPLQRLSPCRY